MEGIILFDFGVSDLVLVYGVNFVIPCHVPQFFNQLTGTVTTP